MVDCKINVEGRTYWGNIQLDKTPTEKFLDKKIRQKEDVYANNDYRKLKMKIESEGGKWDPGHGISYGVTKEGWVYQYMTEHEAGVSQTTIVALDADPPFVAYLHLDLQFVPPEKRDILLKELDVMAKAVVYKEKEPPVLNKPKTTPQAPRVSQPEIIVILPGDWLSKISQARWGTFDWERHMRPTEMTKAIRKEKNEKFDEDKIYPGDTFEVIPAR